MQLVLRIQCYRNAPAMNEPAAHFSIAGGTIGRSPENDMVLPDPSKYISRSHGKVFYRDGDFYLADIGSNPSLINDRPLGNGREVKLAAGDRIAIGDYLIEAQFLAPVADDTFDASSSPQNAAPPHSAPALPVFAPPPSAPPYALPVFESYIAAEPTPAPGPELQDPLAGASILDGGKGTAGNEFDLLGLNLGGVRGGAPGSIESGLGMFRGSAGDHESPEIHALPPAPAVVWPAGPIPDGYDPFSNLLPAPTSPAGKSVVPPEPVAPSPGFGAPILNPVPQANAKPGAAAGTPATLHTPMDTVAEDTILQALLRGLGLTDLDTRHTGPELAELVGAMLREATGGAMQTLRARALTKQESRIERTMIGAHANNPLKFFPDAETALKQMLAQARSGGYMKPVDAYRNAFDDLQAHELAVMAGMRAALAEVLSRFDPAAIESRLNVPTVVDKMMASSRKAKMWDRLVVLYGEISREADDDFQRLFGEKFASAYGDQIKRMRVREK